jgi:hypothetical protein
MATPTLKPLAPEEAVRHFRSKGLARSFAWQDVWQEEHAKAFTVAKAMNNDVLGVIRQAVDQAISEGTTFEEFSKGLRPQLEARGWWGRSKMTDPQTGKERTVQLGSPRRLRTIFNTNLRTAYAAGQWERIQATKSALPFLLYHHTDQNHARPQHRAWGAQPVCLPVDHPWWQTHYPPNGWGCKCFVTQLNGRMMAGRGLTATEEPIKFPPKAYTNPRTGEVSVIEQGIDPGWSYNVGEAYLAPVTPKPGMIGMAPSPGDAIVHRPTLPKPRPGPAVLPEDVVAKDAEDAFLSAFGATRAKAAVFTDVGGEPFVAGGALFADTAGAPVDMAPALRRALPLAAAAIRAPDEIRWIWRETPAGPQLVRRYIARLLVKGEAIGVAVDVAAGGSPSWTFATTLQTGIELEALRVGDLAWSSTAPKP